MEPVTHHFTADFREEGLSNRPHVSCENSLDHLLAYFFIIPLSFQNKLVILKRDSTIKFKAVRTSYLRIKEEVIMAKYVSVKLPDAWMSF